MIDNEKIVADIVQAAGGIVVGRIRLQKTAYLLKLAGFIDDIYFDYYHYGPSGLELITSLKT